MAQGFVSEPKAKPSSEEIKHLIKTDRPLNEPNLNDKTCKLILASFRDLCLQNRPEFG